MVAKSIAVLGFSVMGLVDQSIGGRDHNGEIASVSPRNDEGGGDVWGAEATHFPSPLAGEGEGEGGAGPTCEM